MLAEKHINFSFQNPNWQNWKKKQRARRKGLAQVGYDRKNFKRFWRIIYRKEFWFILIEFSILKKYYPSCQNKIPPPEPLFQKPRLRKNFMLKRGFGGQSFPSFFFCHILGVFTMIFTYFMWMRYSYHDISTIVNLACANTEGTVGEDLRKISPIYVCIFYIFYHLAYFLCNIFVWKSSVWISMNTSIINGIY